MTTAQPSPPDTALTPARIASAVAILIGVGLASYGGYTQYALTTAIERSPCPSCAAWDPVAVVAPLVLGIVLVATGSFALART